VPLLKIYLILKNFLFPFNIYMSKRIAISHKINTENFFSCSPRFCSHRRLHVRRCGFHKKLKSSYIEDSNRRSWSCIALRLWLHQNDATPSSSGSATLILMLLFKNLKHEFAFLTKIYDVKIKR
jgi:hypothetical protein